MKSIWRLIAAGWCRVFHADPMWPIHGQYLCRICLRSHSIPALAGPAAGRALLRS